MSEKRKNVGQPLSIVVVDSSGTSDFVSKYSEYIGEDIKVIINLSVKCVDSDSIGVKLTAYGHSGLCYQMNLVCSSCSYKVSFKFSKIMPDHQLVYLTST